MWNGYEYYPGYDFWENFQTIEWPGSQNLVLDHGWSGPSACIYNASTSSIALVTWRHAQNSDWEGGMAVAQGSCGGGGGGGEEP